MREFVKAFFSLLHREHLKPSGYRKLRHTFSREMSEYTEHVQFQGSSWNDAASPWRFYINFGVQFAGVSPRTPDRDFPDTHCWTRIEHIVPDALSQYDIPEADLPAFAAEIAAYVASASEAAARHIARIREDYERTHVPRLTIEA